MQLDGLAAPPQLSNSGGKMDLNVFKLLCTKRYYLTHPLKFVRQCVRNLKMAYMRARYGWCNYDAWDFDLWFCSVVPPMLKKLAKGDSWPHQEFNSIEEWQTWLLDMAAKIEKMQYDDWMDSKNEYAADYNRTFDDNDNLTVSNYYEHSSLTKEEIRKNYYERAKEIALTRQQDLRDFAISFFEKFDVL